jgi:uncharacterized protein (DUF1015 family)
MIHIQPFEATLPKTSMINAPDSFFTQVKEQYKSLSQAGYFHKETTKSFYVYRIEGPHGKHTGLLVALPVQDYLDGNVLKHEQTIAIKESKTTKLVVDRGAMIKPVVLAYRPVESINLLLAEIIAEGKISHSITLRSGKHTFWGISDVNTIGKLQTYFAQHVPEMYIADGHHRVAGAANLYTQTQQHEYILSALFATSELHIWDYNRIVEGFNNQTALSIMAKLGSVCHIEALTAAAAPTQKHELTMCIEGQWFLLKWRSEITENTETIADSLDATLLNMHILNPILGITDIRTDNRVSYCEGVRGLSDLAQRGNRIPTVSFALFPVSTDDFLNLADSNESMPPKSTWFEPRIKNGLIAMEI